ncbi:hypothetical protein [Streptomyces sp. NPDC002671]
MNDSRPHRPSGCRTGRPTVHSPEWNTTSHGQENKPGPGTDGRLAVGERVIACVIPFGPHGGAYAEQLVVHQASVVPAPAKATFPEAATLLLNAITARLSLDAQALGAVADGGALFSLKSWTGPAARRQTTSATTAPRPPLPPGDAPASAPSVPTSNSR